MKKSILLLVAMVTFGLCANAQMVSFTLQESLTATQLDSSLSATGFALPIPPQYDIEVYQVIYKTPYKHIDSLVNASGIVVFPTNTPCPSALGCYAHGSFSKRVEVPSYEGAERPIGLFFAGIGGVVTAMPDELGLGDSDSTILIHPYINGFHSGHASVNLMRAARELADELEIPLSGEVALTGYSQGGYTTMATNKLIQENFSSEFDVVASAPMSGPYDLNVTMVEVMLDSAPYSVPSYLPYLLLGYHSVYESLQQIYPTPSDVFESPYDTVLPPLYYSKNYSLGEINAYCDPIPRNMLKASVVQDFTTDPNHPLRQILAENDLLGWTPENFVKIQYCSGDDQVNPLNAVRADSAWRANGATEIYVEDFGNETHGGCVQPAITSTALLILGMLSPCTNAGILASNDLAFEMFPNPSSGQLTISKPAGVWDLNVYNLSGQGMLSRRLSGTSEQVDISSLPPGFYVLELSDSKGASARKSLIRH